jgi:hypothetical protein
MSNKEISITGQDGDYLLIADLEKNYKSRIHKSLIIDNELEVVNGKFQIDGTLYKEWFKDAMRNAFSELCDLFYSNIPLFVEKRDVILQNQRYYSIIAPKAFYTGMFIGSRAITLGEMLLIWENEPDFVRDCECGGRRIIYSFMGSPLSGSCSASNICLQCGKEKVIREGNFSELMMIKGKYHPIEPFSDNPVAVKELIAILEGKLDLSNAVAKDDFCGIPGNMTITVGNKTVPNETFSKIFIKKDN